MNRTVSIEKLSAEAFAPFGTFAKLINPQGNTFGTPPIQFTPDMLRLDMGGQSQLGISVCRVEWRPLVVDKAEFHTSTGEGILPLNAGVLIHVAPPSGGVCPVDKIRIFRVPSGTCVVLHPGTWHHAPFVADKTNGSASVFILLPVRTYANDCIVRELAATRDHVEISNPIDDAGPS